MVVPPQAATSMTRPMVAHVGVDVGDHVATPCLNNRLLYGPQAAYVFAASSLPEVYTCHHPKFQFESLW